MASKVSPKIVSVWQKAVEAFDDNRLEEAREQFREIHDHSAKISFNLATVDLLSKNYAAALEVLTEWRMQISIFYMSMIYKTCISRFICRKEKELKWKGDIKRTG